MSHTDGVASAFQRVLEEELPNPLYLSREELAGGWRELFPELAEVLGPPYPIFGRNEDQVVSFGFPVLVSAGIQRLRVDMERQVDLEVDYRLESMVQGAADKGKLMAQRERYRRSLSALIENTLVNDYGRGLVELFLLFHSSDIQYALGRIPRALQQRGTPGAKSLAEEMRLSVAEVFADLIQRAAVTALDSLKRLSHNLMAPRMSPLLRILCQDQLLLTEIRPPRDLYRLSAYLSLRFRRPGEQIIGGLEQAARRLRELVERQPQLGDVLRLVSGEDPLRGTARVLLEPKLLEVLEKTHLAPAIELSPHLLDLARELAVRLKCFELLWALRQRILRMEMRGHEVVLSGASSATPLAPSTRPFDFASPGVVSSQVRRFGLVYDLTNFTALLEGVRKKGRGEEERALQFMYVFQGQLEEIRRRHRLTFEKFLGDGAFYTSRRGLRLIAAACEIQELYRTLLTRGFPFNQGMRIALNYGSYQLLPMRTRAAGGQRFEFFGPGIVELARLTTGKSTREVEQIAEFLVHSGYDPDQVESFLGPLIQARSGREERTRREFAATLDRQGELVNEGIVMTLPLLEGVESELEGTALKVLEQDELRWTLVPLEADNPRSMWVGLRYMGVARLKGMDACELVEGVVWPELPAEAESRASHQSIIDQLRRRATVQEEAPHTEFVTDTEISEDLVVLSYRDGRGERQWIFGEYRVADDILLHAINVPLDVCDLDDETVVEIWLLQNRFELAKIYQSLRRETSGLSTPLAPLRSRDAYVACFLAAPHKGPQ